jgi:hypothetical protein
MRPTAHSCAAFAAGNPLARSTRRTCDSDALAIGKAARASSHRLRHAARLSTRRSSAAPHHECRSGKSCPSRLPRSCKTAGTRGYCSTKVGQGGSLPRAKGGTDVSQTADRCRGKRACVVLCRERWKRGQGGGKVRRLCRWPMRSGAVVRSRSGTVRASRPSGDLRESPAALFSAVSAGLRLQWQYLCERLPSNQEQGGEKARRQVLKFTCTSNGVSAFHKCRLARGAISVLNRSGQRRAPGTRARPRPRSLAGGTER